MPRSFASRPALQRFLAAPGPVVIYGLLAVAFGVGAFHIGWQSAGCALCIGLALFSSGIVAGEIRYLLTGRHG